MKRYSTRQLVRMACKQMCALEELAQEIASGFVPADKGIGIKNRPDAMTVIIDCTQRAVRILSSTEILVKSDEKAMRQLGAYFSVIAGEMGKHLVRASQSEWQRRYEAGL